MLNIYANNWLAVLCILYHYYGECLELKAVVYGSAQAQRHTSTNRPPPADRFRGMRIRRINMFLDETQSANTKAANDSRLVVAGTTRSGDRYETIRFI